MSRLDVIVSCERPESFRVQQISGLFDVPLTNQCEQSYSIELPSEQEDWQIGAIVGPTGSGKSSVAKAAYQERFIRQFDWPTKKAVIDGFAEGDIAEIVSLLTSVGFSSPPSWIKPYSVLSTGEKFRCDLARALHEGEDLIAFDEFTSVVDRTVAQFGSMAIAKTLRTKYPNKKFVAVTCHPDVLQWLEADWVLDMQMETLSRRRLRRSNLEFEVDHVKHSIWRMFKPHHYLDAKLSKFAKCFAAFVEEQPVAFCAVLPMLGKKKMKRISRLVVLPDFQGVGIGTALLRMVAKSYFEREFRVRMTTGHPGLIQHLKHTHDWVIDRVSKTGRVRTKTSMERRTSSFGRSVVHAEYVGEAKQ